MLQYLRAGDLARAHLPALQRRCRRHAFFVAAIAALRARTAWCPELWCASIREQGPAAAGSVFGASIKLFAHFLHTLNENTFTLRHQG